MLKAASLRLPTLSLAGFGLSALLMLGAGAPAEPFKMAGVLPNQGFTAEHLKQIKASGLKVMLPTYIPQGYKVYSAYGSKGMGGGPGGGPRYMVAYTSPGAEMFAIEAVSDGIGGPPADKVQKVQNPQLGTIEVFTQLPNDGRPFYLTQWIGKGPFYHVTSPALVNRKLQPQPMPEHEFVKVVKSLVYITF